jgi:hypothetical protein
MKPEIKVKIDNLRQKDPHDLDGWIHGWLRYEALRKLNVMEFAGLFERNIRGENFDEMIDELILLH